MSQADSTSRSVAGRPVRGRAVPGRSVPDWVRLLIPLGIVTVVVGGSIGWQLIHGGRFAPLPTPRLHAPRWDLIAAAPAVIRLHIAAAVLAFLVGAVLLLNVKGTTLHKTLGWTWVIAMGTTAASSLLIKVINPGHWSFIHFLSGWVLIALPIAIVAIKRKNVGLHRRLMTGVFVGGLVIAGAFTFAPGRLMFQVFFG